VSHTSNLRDVRITINGNRNVLKIGNNCSIRGVRIYLRGDGNHIEINDGVMVNASNSASTLICADGGKGIVIGAESLLSDSIEMHTTDYHGIYDTNTGKRLNEDRDIIIGKHVWISKGVMVLKGAQIASGCVIAARSVVCGKHVTENCILAGIPAKAIRYDVGWSLERSDKIKIKS